MRARARVGHGAGRRQKAPGGNKGHRRSKGHRRTSNGEPKLREYV